jgi:hypothetical protein
MARDPETLAHLEWLGYVQPVGLVVSIPALLAAQAHVGRVTPAEHQPFLAQLPRNKDGEIVPQIPDLRTFVQSVLAWEANDLQDPPASLEVALPEYNETLRPTFAVPEFQPKNPERPWLMLVQSLPAETDFDAVQTQEERHWQATPQARFERLLRETEVPIGVLFNHTHLRLVYAPRGETSGYADFSVADMAAVAGRPIFAALRMLLHQVRLFRGSEKERLPAILADSRKYQNVVSTQLAEQVLAALYELLRGFQAADDAAKGRLLHDVLATDPNHVYSGLLTVLMRLVFILYAEDRGLLSTDSVYVNYYSVTGLFDRLRADAGRFPDTMDQRFGGWAQLLTLFRLIHEGGSHAAFHIPARKGYLFDPNRYPFLEGQFLVVSCQLPKQNAQAPDTPQLTTNNSELTTIPRVSDGVLFRVLSNLLILDGERLNYRNLDVEPIGSVYEAIMGFNLEVAGGRSIAVKPAKSHGAPTTINLEALLAAKSGDRAKWLSDHSDQKLTGHAADALKKAATIDELLAALEKKIARSVTPNVVSKGAMIFQPSDERRRSGSHYTPRSLTEPIVRKTLEPILTRIGEHPTPQQILDLKICDPAMGSAAFLVATCRQLGDVLVKAWHIHNQIPAIPPDEDEILHARRLVAQRCLYGVDKNPMAVDLAKLSLWLATLAKDHPFTFLDHALRHGDSLVGLTRKQIADFHWLPTPVRVFGQEILEERTQAATRLRQEIIEAGDDVPFLLKQQKLALADESLYLVRFAGNLVIAAFFAAGNDKKRKQKREELLQQFTEYLRTGNMALRPTKAEHDLRSGDKAIHPFHWEIEFPEVFGRDNGGFDAIVGNPPFLGGLRISSVLALGMVEFLKNAHQGAGHLCDLVAHFFRRSFGLLQQGGSFGLLATNSIAQGDTRNGGLTWICTHGGQIFNAIRRYRWPGQAAVVVSIVHVCKGPSLIQPLLDGRPVPRISAYLFLGHSDADPARLAGQNALFTQGSNIAGSGFVIGDGEATTLEDMRQLLQRECSAACRILPYLGGEEINQSPTQLPQRYVIYLSDLESEGELSNWPELASIVRDKVKPQREMLPNNSLNNRLKRRWWTYHANRFEFYRSMSRVMVTARIGNAFAFTFLPSSYLMNEKIVLFRFDRESAFATIQSRVHEIWARFFSSTLKDDLQYTPSDCFETFPFPENFQSDTKLETVGKEYYQFRAALMVKNNEGLTKTYNRFHDPNESSPDIHKLRELHAAMDRAVLDAYGWTTLRPACEFLLDYEEEEEDDDTGSARRRRKPWRYRWPDEFRDTVLARLLELNKRRAEQERLSGETTQPPNKMKNRKAQVKVSDDDPCQ